jgi:DNA polymerase III epsilon subunit-like protein
VLLCCVAITPAGRLQLKRPLVTFDIESTGLNVARDRILEIAAIKLLPDGTVGIAAFCAVKAALLSCWCTSLLYHCCGGCPWHSMQDKAKDVLQSTCPPHGNLKQCGSMICNAPMLSHTSCV